MQVTLTHIFLLLLAIGTGAWIWRIYGLHDYAVQCARQHCEQEGLILLDNYAALSRIRLRMVSGIQFRLERTYRFEFTVEGGEQRYSGEVILWGTRLRKIILAPYPVSADDLGAQVIVENAPKVRMLFPDFRKPKE